jgi:hypothetical protein
MPPFSFPDPNTQTEVTNPFTGDVWVYVNGIWQVQSTGSGSVSSLPDLSTSVTALQAELTQARQDIIDLRAQLAASGSTNNFLILE